MRPLSSLLILWALQASFHAYSADLSYALTPDLAAEEQHIINGTSAYINQNGYGNTSLVEQSGSFVGNFVNIGQTGSNNWAKAVQIGDLNFVNMNQYGNDNYANAEQRGSSNSIILTQTLNGNQFNGIQNGNNNIFNATQNGNSLIGMSAQGNGNSISANMPAGTNYQINIIGDNVKASSVGQ